jgi:hypothetical protein
MGRRLLPHKVIVPAQLQVAHIGMEGGLHQKNLSQQKINMMNKYRELQPFHEKPEHLTSSSSGIKVHDQGFGGWGHPADHEHCLKLFGEKSKNWREALHLQ